MHKVRNEVVIRAFGQHLRTIRKSKNLTQEELSFKADIAFSSVARIEAGQLNTTISTVARLASALNVEISELMSFDYKKD